LNEFFKYSYDTTADVLVVGHLVTSQIMCLAKRQKWYNSKTYSITSGGLTKDTARFNARPNTL